jgi:hypothetical protein
LPISFPDKAFSKNISGAQGFILMAKQLVFERSGPLLLVPRKLKLPGLSSEVLLRVCREAQGPE